MQPGSFVGIARVVKTHGLKGEVVLAVSGDLPFALPEGLEVWFVPPPSQRRSSTVVGARSTAKGPLVTFEGVEDIDTARSLVGREVLARESDLPAALVAPEEETDVIGYSVTDVGRGLLGEVVEIIVTGANDVWVVHGPLGEVLLPVIDDVVLGVDDEAASISVRLLPGLLEEGEDT